MAVYALTIFTGAFLLFQVQPLIGKYILPWFGGGPGVWTMCMLFFQMLLLGGYAYAHVITQYLKARRQAALHFILLLAALAMLPITPADSWKPAGGGNPTLQILALLCATIGPPYFVLSATGPLLQQWFSRTNPGASPYRLYALSNIGSLLALLTYPFYFETHFTRVMQARLWAGGLIAYAVCCGLCALRLWKTSSQFSEGQSSVAAKTSSAPDAPIPLRHYFLWLLLPACASVLLLATTNKLCQDVAVFPFLWVAPLAIYLLSFIVCFDSPRWYMRFPFTLALIAALGALSWALFHASDWSVARQVAVYCGGLFVCCMVCHGELYRLKPDPRHLTRFYLMIASGGALGGLFVAVGAPLIFKDYYELHWGLMLCAFLFLFVCATEPIANPHAPAAGDSKGARQSPAYWRGLACLLPVLVFGGLDWFLARLAAHHKMLSRNQFIGLRIGIWTVVAMTVLSWVARGKFRTFRHWRALTCLWLLLGALALSATLWMEARESGEERTYRSRNFYGVLTVYEHNKSDPLSHHFLLQHGRITHGLQFADPARSRWPVSYYGPESGIALGVGALPARPRRIGVVGLGTGTMAAHARPGDSLRIYEINPQVVKVATTRFSYLAGFATNSGKLEIVLGDARLSLEKEPSQQFDLLVLDAFSSDAIPIHLLTREAFAVYQRHLDTNGIIAVHISNRYLDLEPVVVKAARAMDFQLAAIDYDDTEDEAKWWLYSSTWVLLSHNRKIINSGAIREAAYTVSTNDFKGQVWTDDFASLFPILRR